MGMIIDATETAGYQMKEGDGPAACLEWDGNFNLAIVKGKRNEKQASSGNTTVSFVLSVQDSDFEGAKGAVVYHSFPVTGKVEKGTNAGRMNVGTLIDLCTSAGRQDLVDTIIGKKFDVDALLKDLVGNGTTQVFARLTQQEDDRNNSLTSKPSFYIRKAKYDETKQSGANFRVRPASRKGRSVGQAASATNGAAGAAVHATDAMDQGV